LLALRWAECQLALYSRDCQYLNPGLLGGHPTFTGPCRYGHLLLLVRVTTRTVHSEGLLTTVSEDP